jgi:hypothetical protein
MFMLTNVSLCGNRIRDLLRSRRVFRPLRQIGRYVSITGKINLSSKYQVCLYYFDFCSFCSYNAMRPHKGSICRLVCAIVIVTTRSVTINLIISPPHNAIHERIYDTSKESLFKESFCDNICATWVSAMKDSI